MSSIETNLNKDGVAMATTNGDSMYPMLSSGDIAIVEKIVKPLKVSDIPVYHRDDHLTMHRIVRIKNGKYIICGDNRFLFERDITDNDIIGVLSAFYHKGRYISVNDDDYIKYCRKIESRYMYRAFIEFFLRVLGKIRRALKV